MTSPEGGFYSATDADSEGVEGKFFVWSPEEIRAAVQTDEDARRSARITMSRRREIGNIQNVLHTPKPIEAVAKELGITVDELQETIARVKPMVYAARAKRVPPGLDDKVITAWNGMMICAMAEAGRVFDMSRYRDAAQRASDFLLGRLSKPDGRLLRTYRAGTAHLDAYLEDYAYFAEGLIETYEAGGDERYVLAAVRLAERMLADFADDKHGGFFTTASGHESLIMRSREGPDGATPSGNAVAVPRSWPHPGARVDPVRSDAGRGWPGCAGRARGAREPAGRSGPPGRPPSGRLPERPGRPARTVPSADVR